MGAIVTVMVNAGRKPPGEIYGPVYTHVTCWPEVVQAQSVE